MLTFTQSITPPDAMQGAKIRGGTVIRVKGLLIDEESRHSKAIPERGASIHRVQMMYAKDYILVQQGLRQEACELADPAAG